MVKVELYVPGIKGKEMVEIAHGEVVEGSRGKRHRLYGTYTDPVTKKIHKANSFVSKAKYDKAVAEMTAGMPVEDIEVTQVSIFAEDSPVTAEPNDLGGPTEPDNAGVPTDVGGDEPVPMGDEPSDIQEFEAEYHQYVYVGDDELAKVKGYKWCIENDRDVQNWIIPEDEPQFFTNQFGQIVKADRYEAESFEAEKKNCGCGKDPCITYGAESKFDELAKDIAKDYREKGKSPEEAMEIGEATAAKIGRAKYGTKRFAKMGKNAETDVGTTIDDIIMDEYVDEGEALEDAEDYARKARQSLNELGAEESDLTGIIVQDNDPSSPPDGIFATEQEREVEDAARKKEYGYTHSSMDDYRPELDDSSFVEEIDESALYEYEMEQERLRENPVETQEEVVLDVPITPEIEETVVETTTGPEPGTWAAIALDMALSGDMTPEEANRWKDEMKERGFDAEMTLREWGESELDESKHDFSENPNESFREWIDEEVKAHGDVSFKDWAKEEEEESFESESLSAEFIHTNDTQLAVALGIPPEIWLDMSKETQDEYIASMELNVGDIRYMASNGYFQDIMSLANIQKETVTSGDLTLIECNVCGISASQLLDSRGGVCEITDPNAGANPNYLRGVSCPFEKYYSLTRAVYDAVEEDLAENKTVVQLITPRPAAFAAESTTPRVSKLASAMSTFKGQRVSKAENLMDITKDTSLGDFTSKELTESSAIQGDFDHASLNFSGRQNIQARAETFRAYDDAISDRQRYKIEKLGGKVDSSMNRSEASDYIKELQGRESGTWKSADTFQADSWDDLYVVAENQMGGWKACDVTDGVLQTYANQADAEREAQMTIDDLNSMGGDYSPTSWAGKRLSEVDVADNVEFIRYPNGLEAPYDELHRGRSMNDPVTQLNATRGIDTFTEPFEDDEESSNWLLAAGIAGVFALGAWLLPKGD